METLFKLKFIILTFIFNSIVLSQENGNLVLKDENLKSELSNYLETIQNYYPNEFRNFKDFTISLNKIDSETLKITFIFSTIYYCHEDLKGVLDNHYKGKDFIVLSDSEDYKFFFKEINSLSCERIREKQQLILNNETIINLEEFVEIDNCTMYLIFKKFKNGYVFSYNYFD